MDTARFVLRSAKSFFAGTALSRLSGLFREMAMAACFGCSPEIGAFMVAYRFANLFRRLVGEGNVQASFIPYFTEMKEQGALFFRDAAWSLSVALLVLVALLEISLCGATVFASPDWKQIIHLTQWMVPGLFFICLYALNSALLHCQNKYFLPAAAPIAFNAIWIGAVLIKPDVHFLSFAVSLAFAGQWLLTAFAGFRSLSLKQWLRPRLFSPEVKRLVGPLFLGMIGVGAVQLNSTLDVVFARIADLQGPTYLWYAIRIQQLPLALFGIALSRALLPPLARCEDQVERKTLLHSALKQSFSLMLLCTLGIFAFGKEGIQLLYAHGKFSFQDVAATSRCLWGYGLGLIPAVFVLILTTKCHAEKNYQLPAKASVWAVWLNLFLNALFVFVFGWGAFSIAIATSLSSLLNAALLAKGAFDRSLWPFFWRVGVAGFTALGSVWWIKTSWILGWGSGIIGQLLDLAVFGLFFLAMFGISMKILNSSFSRNVAEL